MNRVIKFRAWDGDKMHYTDKHGMLQIEATGCSFIAPPYLGQDAPLMQFTGLLDKNGKEIYEGDVVHCEDVMVAAEKVFRTDESKEIIFSDGAFRYDGITLGDMTTAKHVTFEVIGNIYENPELLSPASEKHS